MEKPAILKNKYYLYVTEFFAGMSVMAVELGASRLLAPYFSSSQIVWTIIIGTIMIAMALGNIWGGRMADRDPNPDRLYMRLLFAAIWIALIPVLGKYVIIAISAVLIFTISSHFLVLAAFAACLVIFVFPLFLLGTVTPSLVKYTMDNLTDNGKTVGSLNACNTIGSILGTFLPTFVTIPAVGTSLSFLIFSGVLMLLSLIYFINTRSSARRCTAAAAIFVLCVVFGHSSSFAFWEEDLLYEGESIYNYLQVKETDRSIILSTNVLFGVQSVAQKDGGLTGMYYDTAMAAPLMADYHRKDDPEMLILGMGSGTYARQCLSYLGDMQIEGVEIDKKITDLAAKYFDLPDTVAITTYDGRAYLQAMDKKYDVIMVDAYQDITIPFQMSSIEFFTLVRDHLTADGVMVVNMNMHSEAEGNINDHLADTIAAVFDHVYTADVPYTTNRELFASNSDQMLTNFAEGVDTLNDPDLKSLMQTIARDMTPYQSKGYLLTDDKAPVELLGMRIIDELIADEVGYYKGIYDTYGLRGLVDQLL